MEEQPMEKGVSRRSMLKRLGAGAAVAWSAPVLTTLGTPAFAQTPICDTCTSCEFGQPCGDCACVGTPAPECFCTNVGVCLNEEPICQQDADCDSWCGPGGRCAECDFVPGPECFDRSCWCACGSRPRGAINRPGVRVVRL
jgi:hypothetical protein